MTDFKPVHAERDDERREPERRNDEDQTPAVKPELRLLPPETVGDGVVDAEDETR